MNIDSAKTMKLTIQNDQGKETVIYDTLGRIAMVFGLDETEIVWAIEEHGKCEAEGLWPGQTVRIEEANLE